MKIVVIRFSSIGDIVITTPVIRSLKAKYQEAEIHFITKKQFSSLLAFHPDIDTIHALEDGLIEIRKNFNAQQDIVIDLHKNIRSKRIRKLLGGRQFEFKKLNIQKWLFTTLKIKRLPNKHLIDRYFDGLRGLGLSYDKAGLDFYIDPEISIASLALPPSYYVFAIGGTYATKRLPNRKIIELCNKINQTIVLIGGTDDMANSKQISSQSKNNIIDLCGKLSVHESARLMQKSIRVFCHDSGMMHIAAALKLPLSLIWGNTHPLFGMYPLLPSGNSYGLQEYQVDVNCRPCSKLGYDNCPKGDFRCMNNQNVDEIVKNCDSIDSSQ